MKKTISIIIVNYNVKHYLANCIESICDSDYNGDIDIIVVDNNSYDGSVSMIRERFPFVKLIENDKNLGFAKGVNLGLRIAFGDYIILLNPDTVVEERTLSVLYNYMEENPEVGICGPKIINADGSLQLACKRSFPTPWVALPKILGLSKIFPNGKWTGKYNLTYLNSNQIHSVEAISGSFMFMRRSVLINVGELDETFFMFGEDLDFCYRSIQSGFEIHYVPYTQIIHYKGESVKSSPHDSTGWFYQAMDLFVNKHFSTTASILTKAVLKIGISLKKGSSFFVSSLVPLLPVLLDLFMVVIAFFIAITLRFGSFEPVVNVYFPVLTLYSLFWISVGGIFQIYSRFVLAYNRAMLSSILGFLLSVAFTYFFKQIAYSRAVILGASLIITLLIPGWRLVAHVLKSRGFFRNLVLGQAPIFSRPARIVGGGSEGQRIAQKMGRRPDTGIYIVGFVDPNPEALIFSDKEISSLHLILGSTDAINSIVVRYEIRELIFTSDRLDNKEIVKIMDNTKHLRLTYRVVPRERDILLGKASVEDVSDFPFVSIEYNLYHRLNVISKRIFDIIFSTLIIIFTFPLFLVLIIKFRKWNKREFWGREGRVFNAWVFPTKKRILGELPLMINVLFGEMSFVGTAMIPKEKKKINLICKPGLTGLDRIRKYRIGNEERTIYDHYYVQHQSMAFDVEIIIRSVLAL